MQQVYGYSAVSSLQKPLFGSRQRQPSDVEYSCMLLKPPSPGSVAPGEESTYDKLKNYPIPPGWTRRTHHCTIEYNPVNGRYPSGTGQIKVSAIRKTNEVIYAIADPPDYIKQWAAREGLNQPWHITIATAPGIPAVRAKEMTAQNIGEYIERFDPPLSIDFEAGGFTFGGDLTTANPK